MNCRECVYYPCTKPVCIMGNKRGCDNFRSINEDMPDKDISDMAKAFAEAMKIIEKEGEKDDYNR